jgi:hypothetical protein
MNKAMEKQLLDRLEAARKFPDNTCAASRHTQMIGESLLGGDQYPLLTEEPEHCAVSLLAVVAALYETRTERDRLTTELAAAKRDAEWQLIESATKDGQWIITFDGMEVEPNYWSKDFKMWAKTRGTKQDTVTHWKPLPAPPDAAIAEQEPK